jgi:predicted short-subunit dehydrogenase-like oxidoreductase (DUF2520 family)
MKLRIFVFGAGKVGRALAAALRRARWKVTVRAARRGLPKRIDADLVVLTLRDRELPDTVRAIVERKLLAKGTSAVHCSGAQDASILAPLRALGVSVAQMHPMISFASLRTYPALDRGNVHVQGDAVAVRRARAVAHALGMTPRTFARLDPVGYHAAAGLVANGSAALAALGQAVLVAAGVPKRDAPKLLGPLLRSVAENVEHLGFPDALTGPVRRGDRTAIARARDLLASRVPEAVPLFLATVRAQLPLARELGEAPADAFDGIATWLEFVHRS